MFLVANIPPVHCWIRKEFLYDFKVKLDEATIDQPAPVAKFTLNLRLLSPVLKRRK